MLLALRLLYETAVRIYPGYSTKYLITAEVRTINAVKYESVKNIAANTVIRNIDSVNSTLVSSQ